MPVVKFTLSARVENRNLNEVYEAADGVDVSKLEELIGSEPGLVLVRRKYARAESEGAENEQFFGIGEHLPLLADPEVDFVGGILHHKVKMEGHHHAAQHIRNLAEEETKK